MELSPELSEVKIFREFPNPIFRLFLLVLNSFTVHININKSLYATVYFHKDNFIKCCQIKYHKTDDIIKNKHKSSFSLPNERNILPFLQ